MPQAYWIYIWFCISFCFRNVSLNLIFWHFANILRSFPSILDFWKIKFEKFCWTNWIYNLQKSISKPLMWSSDPFSIYFVVLPFMSSLIFCRHLAWSYWFKYLLSIKCILLLFLIQRLVDMIAHVHFANHLLNYLNDCLKNKWKYNDTLLSRSWHQHFFDCWFLLLVHIPTYRLQPHW